MRRIWLAVFLPLSLLGAMFHAETVEEKLSPVQYAPQEGVCRIFMIRHGETDWNVQGLSQGWTDVPLNEEGRAQAERLALHFSDLSIAAIYSSALSRAVATAELMAAFHPGVQMICDPALRFYDPDKRRLFAAESHQERETRIAEEIAESAAAYLREVSRRFIGCNVVVITHGKVIKHLVEVLSEDHSKVKIGNAALVRVVGTDAGLRLERE